MDRNLIAFLAVAHSETLTDAAAQLHVTQPSITKRIANLEDELGAALFERHRRGMRLTPAGRLLLGHALRMKAELDTAREEIEAIGAGGLDVLRVGAGPLFHLRFIAPVFKMLKDQYPPLTLELIADANVRTIPMLMDHQLDVVMGLITPGAVDDSIHVQQVTHVEHGIVLSPEDPLAADECIDPSLLLQREWVLYTTDPETEQTIGSYYLPKDMIEPKIGVRTSSFTTGLQLVQTCEFVMSAPLQLAPLIQNHGLVIRPAINGMPKRAAGIHVRKSALGFAAIQSLLKFFESDCGLSVRKTVDLPP